MELKSLKGFLPRNREDVVGAKALVKLGYPKVEPVLPQMLDWLKTNGSPVWVSGNRRITFKFVGKDADAVDYEDYH